MSPHSREQSAFFPDLFQKPVTARFDTEMSSSDGGAVLLHARDNRIGLIRKLAACIKDRRAADRSRFSIEDLLRQRVLGIACGYEDGNDAAALRVDPVMKLCASRSPSSDDHLASQPTISRFENSVTMSEVIAMQARIIEKVLRVCRRRYGKKTRRVIIDLDPTDDPTYGSQQLSLFNGHYSNHCYLPLMGFVSFDDNPEQHIVAAILRPGDAPGYGCAQDLLDGLCGEIRRLFPKTRILVRLDGAFAAPHLLEWLDRAPRVDYVINMPKNSILKAVAEPLMEESRTMSEESGMSEKLFGETMYAAKTWNKKRRIVIKAEVTRYPGREPRDNPRFVVTNLKKLVPESVYRIYCKRGDCENRIKEMKLDLESGRTSCTSFVANQLRLIMTTAAYVLLQEIRADAKGTKCERASVATIRHRLLKIGTRLVESTRRIVMHMPRSFAWKDIFQKLAAVP